MTDQGRSVPNQDGGGPKAVRRVDVPPPHNFEAEESLLGAMLLSKDAAHWAQRLDPADFHWPGHAVLFAAMQAVPPGASGYDVVTLGEHLARKGELDKAALRVAGDSAEIRGQTGTAAMTALQRSTPVMGNADRYGEIVEEKARARRLLGLAKAMGDAAQREDFTTAAATLDQAAQVVGDSLVRRRQGPLQFLTAAELVAQVDGEEPTQWLCAPVWPADAYGVIGAEKKAGKTWAILDLIVSVASGRPWLNEYDVMRPGTVMAFLGEGGQRKMLRRARAVCRNKSVDFESLNIEMCFRSPHIVDEEHLAIIRAKIAASKPVLVVVDPLYLAARGAKSSSLFEMGSHLEELQLLCQAVGAALVIVHHWNKTGVGKGSDRFSGVGPAEWGRVLVSVAVERKATDPATRATAVTLAWAFEGDEIPETELRIRRRVWAEDPDDLASPMGYELERLEDAPASDEEGSAGPRMRPSVARVLAVLRVSSTALTLREIGDALASDATGMPLKRRTISAALEELRTMKLAESEGVYGNEYLWGATSGATSSDDEYAETF